MSTERLATQDALDSPAPIDGVWVALVPAHLLLGVVAAWEPAASGGARVSVVFAGAALGCHLLGRLVSQRVAAHLGAGALLLVAAAGLLGGQPLLVVLSGLLLPLVVYEGLPADEAVGWGFAVVVGLVAFSARIGATQGWAPVSSVALTGLSVAFLAATTMGVLTMARARNEAMHARLERAVTALDVGAERIGTALGDRDAALQASATKDEFLSLLSFELRTPLTTIMGHSEMLAELLEELESDEGVMDARAIRRSSNHLLSVVDDVLDLARLEAGKGEVRNHPVDPVAIVTFTAEETADGLDAEVADLQLEPTGLVLTDGQRLGQLVRVLVSRATKRSRGRGPVHVRLRWNAEGTAIALTVRDAGVHPASLSGARAGLEMRYAGSLCEALGGTLTAGLHTEGTAVSVEIPVLSALGRPAGTRGPH
jgi:signal transduction histidine kinase